MKNKVLEAVRSVAKANYGKSDIRRIEQVESDIIKLYSGEFDGYQRCDTPYHDLEHTLEVIVPFVHIIDGWNRAGQKPFISFGFFELGVAAALLHDTGYIKKTGDNDGTGGKYTFVHIGRSVSFAREYLPSRGFNDPEVACVSDMISSTGVVDGIISFSSEEAKICAYALGTADLLGQLSSENYPEKLPRLYEEFREGYDHEGLDKLREKGTLIFENADALVRSTPFFFSNIVKNRLRVLGSVDRFIKYHWTERKDYYRIAIEKNLERLKSRIPVARTN